MDNKDTTINNAKDILYGEKAQDVVKLRLRGVMLRKYRRI